ncbi:MAG: MBOAT family protein [Flavobacterium sp.]|nr:MBOAT family protein [Flavobacterium sp.]
MLFNSFSFGLFLPITLLLYWAVGFNRIKAQNAILLLASYFFYGLWDWRFLFLIAASSLVDYFAALAIKATENNGKQKIYLYSSIIWNLGVLFLFKYYNFFIDEFALLFNMQQGEYAFSTLNLILPVGLSFYTFQTMSYTIDVYKKRIEPTKNLLNFLCFVSFFPQLVAGPIEKASDLLPQFSKQRSFKTEEAKEGLRQILWGLFKKMVIADNAAYIVNMVYASPEDYGSLSLVYASILFFFQIYGDFSGYSDIAIGTAKLFGFKLSKNFNIPYLAKSVAEYWQRWHISLSTWFRDYLYIPLGGSKGGNWMRIRNTFTIFIVSGFWHGANWTFIVWGALNALFIMPSIIMKTNRNNLEIVAKGKKLPTLKELLQIKLTFGLTVFAWIFFRAEDIHHAIAYCTKILSTSLFSLPKFLDMTNALIILIVTAIFMLIEWIGREQEFALQTIGLKWNRCFRYLFYLLITFAIFWFGGKEQRFIYFQF